MSVTENTILVNKEIFEFRSQLVNQFILFIALAALVEAMILISHTLHTGWLPYFSVRIPLILSLWVLFLLRHDLSYAWRTGLVVGGAWISISAHLLQFGPAMNAKSALITLTFFTMLFIGERAGWLTVSAIVALLTALGLLVTQGYVVYQFSYPDYLQRPQAWIGMIFHLTTYSAIVGYIAVKFLQFLQNLLVQNRTQTEALLTSNQQLEAANQAKQAFLDTMSHELNTPLNTLLGYLSLLQETDLTWQQRSHLASVRQSTQHLHSLVNAILNTARLERQQQVLNPVECVLIELLNHVANMMQLKAYAKGLQFQRPSSESLSINILVDTLYLRQVLLNLLVNAIKYTPSGQVQLNVTLLEHSNQQAKLLFAVCDTGIGIPQEEQHRLLQPFERGNTLGNTGTGLGLSIVQQLLQQMNSQLEIDSSPNGSCFRFHLTVPTLKTTSPVAPPSSLIPPDLKNLHAYQHSLLLGRIPLLKQELEQLAQDNSYHLFVEYALQLIHEDDKQGLQHFFCSFLPTNVPPLRLTDLRIKHDPEHPKLLIIDDDHFNVHLIAHYLRDFEFDLLSASNGIEGIQLAQHTHPQLILLDIYMPDMNGLEVCQRLKNDPQLHFIPIIFFSASHQPKDIMAAFAHHGQDYILKPAHEEEVISRIVAHLQRPTLYYPLVNRLTACQIRQAPIEHDSLPEEKNFPPLQIIEKLYSVQGLLLRNLNTPPTLDELARQIGINRNKLNEEFKILFGDSVFAWLREQRLQRARELLENDRLPIQKIAEQVGYTTQPQFSRIFKQRFGQSPKEYRLSLKNSEFTYKTTQ